MSREEVIFWFGWNYGHLDHAFRTNKFSDRMAVMVFTPQPQNPYNTSGWKIETVEVHYDTEKMAYIELIHAGMHISLEGWAI